MFRHLVFIPALVGAMVVLCAAASTAQTNPAPFDLSPYRNKNRLVFVFAPDEQNKAFAEQAALWRNKAAGFSDRDLLSFVVLEQGQSKRDASPLSPREAADLRRRFGVAPGTFHFVLVGKDGHTAFSSDHPVFLSDLFARIDAMPMRQDEMRRKSKPGISKPHP